MCVTAAKSATASATPIQPHISPYVRVAKAVPAAATETPLVAKDLPRINVDASALN